MPENDEDSSTFLTKEPAEGQSDNTYEQQWRKLQQDKQAVLQQEAQRLGCSVQEVAEKVEKGEYRTLKEVQEADPDDDLPDLEDVEEEEEEEAVATSVQVKVETTRYEQDNKDTEGVYNRQLEAEGEYQHPRSTAQPRQDFQSASGYSGPRPGFVFKMGELGLGYYKDALQEQEQEETPTALPAPSQEEEETRWQSTMNELD
mmetsp:Transcript_3600/g.12670  ORF Transcript_3600/g.12670 Transcript_3600/m.12670 type:complete len:202 (+) Transcript_3600:1888-2493(+)